MLVGVAQSVERWTVDPVVVGSIPITHPKVRPRTPGPDFGVSSCFKFEPSMSLIILPLKTISGKSSLILKH